MKKIEELKKELDVVLKSQDIIVDEITTEKKGKYNFLTIVLDKVGGINLDEIVAATNIINPIVDKYDICDDSYILDVISKERGDING
jgi:ribosome maturation factor RimP